MSLFALTRASLGYGERAVLTDVTLSIGEGERVALVGPSGAGKTTLLAALYRQRRERTALVPQDGALVKQLSVYHNVYIGRLHEHSALYNLVNLLYPLREPVRAVTRVLEQVDLADKLFTPVGELSGGQQQRAAVARALYHGGDVLLGDEPVSSVDGWQAQGVLDAVIRSYPTVVLVMHDVKLALQFTTRIIGIRAGRVVLDEPSDGLAVDDLDGLYR